MHAKQIPRVSSFCRYFVVPLLSRRAREFYQADWFRGQVHVIVHGIFRSDACLTFLSLISGECHVKGLVLEVPQTGGAP